MTLNQDNLLSLREAVRYVPSINGRRRAVSTLYRWCRRGIKGIRLEYVRVGRNVATTPEALERFFAALAAADGRDESGT